jgi:uncharacterized membrane protein required for colicin V production
MGIVIDFALVLIVVIFAGIGIYKGFIDSLLKLIGSVGALLIAIFTAKPIVSFLSGIFPGLTSSLGNPCVNWFCSSVSPELLDSPMTEASKEVFNSSLNGGIGDRFVQTIVNSANVDGGQTFREIIANGMGVVFASIIVGIIVFILIKVIVGLIAKLFDSDDKPVLSGINRVLGLALGTIKGVLAVVINYTLLSVSTMVFPIEATVDEYKNQTYVFKNTHDPYNVMVQGFVNDKMGDFVENFTNNLTKQNGE